MIDVKGKVRRLLIDVNKSGLQRVSEIMISSMFDSDNVISIMI